MLCPIAAINAYVIIIFLTHCSICMSPILDDLVKTEKVSLAGLVFAAILFIAGIKFYDDVSFIRGIITSLFGASLSVALSVYFIPTIIKKDHELRSRNKSYEANAEFLEYLNESRKQYIQLEARMANIGHRSTAKWDDGMLREMSNSGLDLLEGIEHEKDNLSIHTSKVMEYRHPLIESRKNEYLHNLRLLRIATRNLMIPQSRNRENESKQFEIARGEALIARDLLSKELEAATKMRNKKVNDIKVNSHLPIQQC